MGDAGGRGAGRSPLRPQRPLPSSPRVRELIVAAHAGNADWASSAGSANSSYGSHKRALVELGPDGRSSFAPTSSCRSLDDAGTGDA